MESNEDWKYNIGYTIEILPDGTRNKKYNNDDYLSKLYYICYNGYYDELAKCENIEFKHVFSMIEYMQRLMNELKKLCQEDDTDDDTIGKFDIKVNRLQKCIDYLTDNFYV